MTYGECKTLKENVLLSDNSIYQDLSKEDLTTFSFLTYYKNLLIKPLPFFLDLRKNENKGKRIWKFNNSLSMNSDFHIKNTLKTLEKDRISDFQARWEFLKYEIRKFLINFLKLQAQNTKKN